MTDPFTILATLVLALVAALIPKLARSYCQRSEASINQQEPGDD